MLQYVTPETLTDTAGRIHATISQCSDMQHFIKSQCGNADFFCLRFHTVLKYHLSINTLHPSPWTRPAASICDQENIPSELHGNENRIVV